MKKVIFPLLSVIFIITCAVLVLFMRDSAPVYVNVSRETEQDIPPSAAEIQLININTASLDELTTLPGIGEVIGQRIIDYREDSGAFASVEEIMEVSGIGESIFENIRDLITI